MNKIYNENFEQYYDKDFVVLPINGKSPDVCGSGWQLRTFNKEQRVGNNIGLSLGSMSGVVCIDIDLYEKEHQEKMYSLLPPLYSGKKGNKGKGNNYFFQYNGEVNRKIRLNNNTAVELLSTGNMTVLPPSRHPDFDYNYEWVGRSLLEVDKDDLPTLPSDFMDQAQSYLEQFETSDPGSRKTTTGRNNKLFEICCAKIEDDVSPAIAIKELFDYDSTNHDPPYFTDKGEITKGLGLKAAEKFYITTLTNLSKKKKELVIEHKESIVISINKVDIKFKEKKRASLPKLKGYGKELFDLCYEHSPIQRSRFSNLSVLMLISTLMGNKFSYNGMQANLFSMIIAPQGGGKDAPLKFPRKVLAKLGLDELVGMSNPASDLALMMNLEEQRTRIDVIDEATKIFRGMGGNMPSNTSGMGDTLNELYSAPCDLYLGRAAGKYKDDKKNKEGVIGKCFSPYINLIGATTFSGFEKTFTEDVFNSGLGSRFLYMFDNDIKDIKRIDTRFELSNELKYFLKSIRLAGDKKTGDNFIDLGDNKTKEFTFIEMKMSAIADEYLDHFNDLCSKIQRDKDRSQKEKSLYSRALLQVQKIAMIHSVMSGNFYNEIKGQSVEWAANWVLSAIKIAKDNVNELINSNQYEQGLNQIEAAVRSYGTTGVLKTELGKVLRKNKNYKQDLLRLLEEGTVSKVKLEKDASNSTRIIHSSFLQK